MKISSLANVICERRDTLLKANFGNYSHSVSEVINENMSCPNAQHPMHHMFGNSFACERIARQRLGLVASMHRFELIHGGLMMPVSPAWERIAINNVEFHFGVQLFWGSFAGHFGRPQLFKFRNLLI